MSNVPLQSCLWCLDAWHDEEYCWIHLVRVFYVCLFVGWIKPEQFYLVCKNGESEQEKLTIHNKKRPVSRGFSLQLPHWNWRKREELNWHNDAIGIGGTGRFRRVECCHCKVSLWNIRDSNPVLDPRDAESLQLCYSIHFVRSVSYKYWTLHVKFSANSQSAL